MSNPTSKELCDALRKAADQIEALEILVDRAESALGLLAEWYSEDLLNGRINPDTIAERAYDEAVKNESQADTVATISW